MAVRGTAEPGVPVELWDWLSLVAHAVADSEGHWSIALSEVESGEHMYFAQTVQGANTPSARSNTITVRVGSPYKQWQVERSPALVPRLKLPGTGIAGITRKLRGRRHPAPDRERQDESFVQEEWEQILRAEGTPLTAQDLPGTRQVESVVASRATGDGSESPPSLTQSEPGAESDTFVDEVPMEIPVTMVEERCQPVWLLAEVHEKTRAAMDLGAAEVKVDTLPPQHVRSAPLTMAAIPTRVLTNQIVVDQPPIYRPITRITPPVSACDLGTAVLTTEPLPGSQP